MQEVGIQTYVAAPGSRYTNHDAAVIGPELYQMSLKGQSTASHILEAAKDPNSPLYPYFEWDDSEAAVLYRENQARQMARAIMLRVTTDGPQGYPITKTFRLFYAVDNQAAEAIPDRILKHYTAATVVSHNPAFASSVIEQGITQLQGWMRRYKDYQEVFNVQDPRWQEIFRMIEDLL